MAVGYKHPRGTRSSLNTMATNGTLVVGQIYLLTDEARLCFATATNAYIDVPKVAELDNPVNVTGSVTLDLANLGRMHRINSASAVTITLPNNAPANWFAPWRQVGAGKPTFSPQASGTLNCIDSAHTKSAGQWSEGTVSVDSNAGTAPVWVLSGATGT